MDHNVVNIFMKQDEINILNEILPNLSINELYTVHYILSRVNNCSWMCMPKLEQSIEEYKKDYQEKIKPYLTQEIIDAISHYDCIGSDYVEYKGIGYNLDKIFHFWSFWGWSEDGGGDKPETYIVE